MSLVQLIRDDIDRSRAAHVNERDVWLHKGLWALIDYRLGHWARTEAPRLLRPLLMALTLISRRLIVETLTGIAIEPRARIGRRFYIAHFGGIFIHEGAVIGDGCQIAQGVTIGATPEGAPRLGDAVVVYPSAVIFGNVRIGDNATVGAGAIVFQDVPAGATAVGVPPARIIPAGHG